MNFVELEKNVWINPEMIVAMTVKEVAPKIIRIEIYTTIDKEYPFFEKKCQTMEEAKEWVKKILKEAKKINGENV